MNFYIVRNNQHYGPYSLAVLRQYVESGVLLLHDIAFDENNQSDVNTVKYFLKQNNVRVKIPHRGNVFCQVKAMGREIIFPKDLLNRKKVSSDRKLLLLALIGLVPLLMLNLIGWLAQSCPIIVFYSISLYFSIIWGLFFYYFFKTKQVQTKTTFAIFFLTQIVIFAIFDLGFTIINPFYWLEKNSNFLSQLLFFVLGVGVTEEIVKAIPLWIIASKSKEPLVPQTLVFYGLISGIAFGVNEGVQYQMGLNAQLDYASSFFMNIARLTSLPFLHAIWCGIAGYFSAFAGLYPKYRKGLYFLAIAIPALMHGIYDTLGGGIIGVLISFFGVVMLMTYLKKGVDNQSKLRQ